MLNFCTIYKFCYIFLLSLFFYLTFVSCVSSPFLFLFPFLLFFLFFSYMCMRVWSRTLNDKLCRVSLSSLENMEEEDNQSLYNENNENNQVRTLRDYMNPTRTIARSCIFFPPDALILILSQTLFNFYLLFMA